MTDVLIIETGNGGDIQLRSNDLIPVNGYENAPYLSMFGGNKWWGNYLDKKRQYASQTEKVLNETALTSAGRVKIEKAINADLAFLNNIPDTKWTVSTAITAPNRLEIEININGKVFFYVWNPDKLFLTYTAPTQ